MVCRVFKKKNYHKALESPLASSASIMSNNLARNDGVLDQLMMYMGRSSSSCKQENNFPNHSTGFLHLPELECPTMNHHHPPPSNINDDDCSFKSPPNELMPSSEPSDWVTLDRLVASQLNGQPQKQFAGYADDDDFAFSFDHDDQVQQLINMNSHNNNNTDRANESETDLWNFARSSSSLSSSSSDPLCHLSV